MVDIRHAEPTFFEFSFLPAYPASGSFILKIRLHPLRAFTAALALLASLCAGAQELAASLPTAPQPIVPQALSKDIWLIPGGFLPKRQPDGNTVVFRGKTGLVVLDTGRHIWQRQAILDLAKAQQTPIVAIVNSHWHLDHVSGNPGLKAAYPAATVYASDAIDAALTGFLKESAQSAREYLKSPDVPPETSEDILGDLASTANGEALKPDVVLRHSGTQQLAGRSMQVNLTQHGPTAGDVWLYDAASGIAAVGDLVTLPAPFLDTACVAGWLTGLEQVEATPFEILIPGHGQAMNRAEFRRYRAAFISFIDCARSDRDTASCAARWVQDAGPLITANGMSAERAQDMAVYYVDEVLRPHGGNSKACAAAKPR